MWYNIRYEINGGVSMKHRLGRLLTSVSLAALLAAEALAVDPAAMTDITGHWAEQEIGFCLEQGLYRGVSETEFAPEEGMTRGMFVTVLGRAAGIDQNNYRDWYLEHLYQDVPVNEYYAPYVNWATRFGIVNGTGDGCFQPEELITREQMAAMIVRYASIYNYEIAAVQEESIVESFSDGDTISQYAAEPVEALRKVGLLKGYANEDGTYSFQPENSTTRAECAALLFRLSTALRPYEGRTVVTPERISITVSDTELTVGETGSLTAVFTPEETSNQTVTWISTNSDIVSVDRQGNFQALAEGTVGIFGYTWNGLNTSCTITVRKKDTSGTGSTGFDSVVIPSDGSVAGSSETYEAKCLRVFGQVVEDPHTYYSRSDTSYLVSVPVQVWQFADSSHTEKVTKTLYVQVHRSLAATVQAIFAEIYQGAEKFPIYSVGGYYDSSYSEHTPGLAVDINPTENYECTNDGRALTGSYWKPGEDPYSIPVDGDVVRAFRNHGFSWGANWNSKKDYMHFSYFGT